MNSFREKIECLTNHSSHNSVRIIQFDNGILRCKGRINNSNLPVYTKRPVLLPSEHMYVTLLIRHFHEQVKHNGVNDTLAALRERYWILRGRQSVKSVLRSCVICLKLEGLPYSYTDSVDLPSDRVSEDPPFAHTGIDFAGPVYVRYMVTSNVSELKAYICLFTCASTRAIHLELTHSLSDDQLFVDLLAAEGYPLLCGQTMPRHSSLHQGKFKGFIILPRYKGIYLVKG